MYQSGMPKSIRPDRPRPPHPNFGGRLRSHDASSESLSRSRRGSTAQAEDTDARPITQVEVEEYRDEDVDAASAVDVPGVNDTSTTQVEVEEYTAEDSEGTEGFEGGQDTEGAVQEHVPLGGSFARDVAHSLFAEHEEEIPSLFQRLREAGKRFTTAAKRAAIGEYQAEITQGIEERHGIERLHFLARVLPSIVLIDASKAEDVKILLKITQSLRRLADEVLGRNTKPLDGEEFAELGSNLARGALSFILPGAYTFRVTGHAVARAVGDVVASLPHEAAETYRRKRNEVIVQHPEVWLALDHLNSLF